MSNVPSRIGNYQLERQIGKGGTGEVWLGRHRTLENRLVAVKLLMSQDTEWVDRFSREANITSRLRHEHIIQIFDHGYQQPFHYTIMEYVAGGSLRSLLKPHQPLPLDLTLRIFHDAGLALDYAHAHGVIHRDISPGNILIEQQTSRVLLTDFGIARESGRTGMTTTSKVMGTPGYLSPEHASSATAVTHLSDIYGIGVVLYEMLSGTIPWDHTPGMPDQTGGPFTVPPKLRERGVQGLPPDVDRVLQTLLALDPAKRYPTVRAAIDDLDQVLERHTSPTQVIGGPVPAPLAVLGFTPPASAPQTIPSKPLEPHPVEKVLGPDLIKGPMQKARERAETLAQPPELAALLNAWSKGSWLRRPLLGRQAMVHRTTSQNVYFYTLKVLYETREPVKTIEEPDHKAQAPQFEREQDRWGVQLPTPKGFQEERDTALTLPGSTQVITCGVCSGHGSTTCPRCKGAARILMPRDAAKGGKAPNTAPPAGPGAAATATATSAQVLVPCPDCSGTGKLRCQRCEGVGRLMQRKTTTWRRRPATFTSNDDFELLDEAWLKRTCKLTTVYQEQTAGDMRPEWKLVPELSELIAKAQSSTNADTRITLSEVQIAFIPITEIMFDLGGLVAPATPPPPAKNGKANKQTKPSKPAKSVDSGLYRWYIYGFERALPHDWRFLNWERVLMYIFAALLVLVLAAIVAISLLWR